MRHRHINPAFTRKEYIKRVPDGKEIQMKWTYGNCNKPYKYEMILRSTNLKYLSINSLDAVRTTIAHALGKQEEGKECLFFMRIHPYPHQLLREHGLLGVQKAERLAKGMKRSFGKTQSKVALVHPKQQIITLRVNDDLYEQGKYALDIASKKISCSSIIEIETKNP